MKELTIQTSKNFVFHKQNNVIHVFKKFEVLHYLELLKDY